RVVGERRPCPKVDTRLCRPVEQQRDVFTRVVGARIRRVVAMIRRDHQRVVCAKASDQVLHDTIELLEGAGKSIRLIPVPKLLVEVYKVRPDEYAVAGLDLLQSSRYRFDAVAIRSRLYCTVEAPSGKQIRNLPDGDRADGGFLQVRH